jgi:hypothetical protein
MVLRVVVGVGLARLQDPDVDPDLGKRLVELLEHDHRAVRGMPVGARVGDVDDECLSHPGIIAISASTPRSLDLRSTLPATPATVKRMKTPGGPRGPLG